MQRRRWAGLLVVPIASCLVGWGASGASDRSDASCPGAQMRVSIGRLTPEVNGQSSASVRLTNTSSRACRLMGYPVIVLIHGDGSWVPFVYSHRGDKVITAAQPTEVRVPP